LINNAGINNTIAAENATRQQWDKILDTNLRSAVHVTRVSIPYLKKNATSSIIFISSTAAHSKEIPGFAPYIASKSAFLGFAAAIFSEVRQYGTKVSCISPGLVGTDLGSKIDADLGNFYVSDMSTSDMIKVEDIGRAVVYVVKSGKTCCPTELILQPQKQFVKESADLVEKSTLIDHIVTQSSLKSAFITGASKGIGRDISFFLAKSGYTLGILARNGQELKQLAQELVQQYKIKVFTYALDVIDTKALEKAINDYAKEAGGISVLVSNAGINRRKSSLLAKGEIWDQIIDVNLRSSMHISRFVLPYLKENGGGAIFYISSIAVKRFGGAAGQGPYYSTKYGLNGFAHCVFEDVRHLNIKVCALCPGLVNTVLGTKPGPLKNLISGDEQIQGSDIVDAIQFVLDCSPTTCPTEIYLDSQLAPRQSNRDLAKRITTASKL